jgi:hypothetical protein
MSSSRYAKLDPPPERESILLWIAKVYFALALTVIFVRMAGAIGALPLIVGLVGLVTYYASLRSRTDGRMLSRCLGVEEGTASMLVALSFVPVFGSPFMLVTLPLYAAAAVMYARDECKP